MTDTTPKPDLTELELREALYEAMDGNLRMSRRRELLAAYRDAILANAQPPAAAAGLAPAADRAAVEHARGIARRLAAHAVGFQDVLDDTDRDPWARTVGADITALCEALDAPAAPVLPAPADRAALAEDLRYALTHREPGHDHEQPGVWDTSGKPCEHCARLAVAQRNLAAYDADTAAALPAPDEPTVRATRYLVTCVPEHRDPGGYRGVSVEYRGDDRWAVSDGILCLGADGRWARERQSSERDEEWLATHRFDLATAQRLAEEQAKDLVRPAKDHRPTAPAQPGKEA